MKFVYLAKKYDLVIGDTFEMFYRGVIRLNNPYKYYILVRCEKGNPFPRYFTYTPKDGDEGEYKLTITLLDDEQNVVDEGTTTLVVTKPKAPSKKLNILCFGDSITYNGVWPMEGYRRFVSNDGTPAGLGFKDTINMIGTCKKEENGLSIGYEGYGSWSWKSFCTSDLVSSVSPVWVKVKKHNLDENDQHSVYKSGKLQWILETIEDNKLKFKRGAGNYSPAPVIENLFEHISGGIHSENIEIESYEFEMGNPFWSKEKQDVDFKDYVARHNYGGIDMVYILLTWNGQYQPYNKNFSHHDVYLRQMLDTIHRDYPNAYITLLGIQICSVNGGMASSYGANGPYSDMFGEVSTAFYYNEYLEKVTEEDCYKDFVRYVDTKAQFDSEYNMPAIEKPVNARSQIKELIGTNGAHPNMAGYLQMGDVFYRALVKDIVDKF